LRLAITNIDLQTDQLNRRVKHLQMDRKKVGPDLKEVRAKLRPEWVPVWIKNPHAFRPSTRMPRFRLSDDDAHAVAAFIWQSGLDTKPPVQPAGDPAKGKENFESRGCMGCHSVREGARAEGGWFGANLSRVGEKASYDYLVRWIHNPRERSAPYCPAEKRDLTADDYKKHNLPYVFDFDHSKCPNDGQELVVEQMTPMPNLRLSWQESRDIASYLMTLKEKDPGSYTAASFLNDPQVKAKGELLVRRYGCSGCHEIAGFEDEGRIGTELTVEGSKPLEQMDFALYVEQARDQDWWTHKGFFEHKLSRPELFDDGMVKTPDERLRMPDFFEPVSSKVVKARPELSQEGNEQIREISTFLMGSVSSQYPERYWYLPEGQRKDIQEGWWIVKKYNCMGCHQFTLDQQSVLMTLPQYQTPDGKGQLPPRLVTEGARVGPEWLARFLANPALTEKDPDRDGVRGYLKARMPTFHFSPIEIQKLVRFFQALSVQPIPYIPQKLAPLTTQETAMARALFTSKGAPCLKCHAIGSPAHDKYATAPNFLLASERLKPDWVTHWILDPAMIDPGTAMPSGLFRKQEGHWVFNGPTPPIFKGYEGDQASLLMRYLFELTPEEQQRLIQMTGGGLRAAPSKASISGPRMKNVGKSREPVVGMLLHP
jgi:cytochrome c551/c552